MRTLQRILLVGLAALSPVRVEAVDGPRGTTGAQEPYRLLVLLRFGDASDFSRLFMERTRRQVQDHLANYFGPLVTLQVDFYGGRVESQHEALAQRSDQGRRLVVVLRELGDRPFDALEAATFVNNEVGGQVVLLQVERALNGYQISTRSWEGRTCQLGSPGITSTPDRQLVGKVACMAVCEAFSPVATVRETGNGVKLSFVGEQWKDQLIRCLRLPCVLQPVQVERRRDGSLVRIPISDTVLRILKDDLKAECFSNRTNPWQAGSRVIEFTAVRIPAVRGTFSLRVLDQSTGEPLSACTVYANNRGFSSLGNADLVGLADRDGYVVSKDPIDRLAFVKISQGTGADFQFPLVIRSASFDTTVRIPRDRAAGVKSEFRRQIRSLNADLSFERSVRDLGFGEINELKRDKRYEDALAHSVQLAGTLKDMSQKSRAQTAKLKSQADSLKLNDKQFENIDKSLADMESWVQELEGHAANLKAIIKENSQRSRAKASIELGRTAEETGDYEQAIANYEQAVEELTDQPKLREKLAIIKNVWKIKSPEHQKARQFVYEIWSIQDISRLDDLIPQAIEASDTLINVNDYLTGRKFKLVILRFVDDLAGLASQLQDAEDRAEVERARETIERLSDLAKRLDGLRPPEVDAEPAQETDPTNSESG